MRTIALPDREEMHERLSHVMEMPALERHFYPPILLHAGRRVPAPLFALSLTAAAREFRQESGTDLGLIVEKQLPRFAGELVDDPEALGEVLELIETAESQELEGR